MKKILITLLVVVIAGLGIWKLYNSKSKGTDEKNVIKIGVITSLTGKFAENGENVRVILELALKDAEPKNVDIQYLFEDFGYESAKAATVTNKLISIDKVNAIISWSAVAANVVSPVADRSKIINFGITNDENAAKGKYNFIHWTPSHKLVDKVVDKIDTDKVKSMAMFVVYQPGLQKDGDDLEKRMEAKGVKVERVNFAIDNKDFNMAVDEMKSKNFDLWYISALPPSLDILLNTFFVKKINKPIIAIDSFNFTKMQDKLDGQEYVTTPEGNMDLLNRVKEKTGSTNFFSLGYVYDAGLILIKTYDDLYGELGRLPTKDEVADRILQLKNFKGAVGELEVDKEGIIQSEAIVKKIVNGKSIVIE